MEDGPVAGGAALIERVKAMVLRPKEEWPDIAFEQQSQSEILRNYVLPLAAIGPVASFLGGQIFGDEGFGYSFRPSLTYGISTALVGYALGIASIFVLAFIAGRLAPRFEGMSERGDAFRLVAYAYTAAWLAGIFGLIPALAVFWLLGLYSIYLLYTGATPVMKVPADKAAGFAAVLGACAVLLSLASAPVAESITDLLVGNAELGVEGPYPDGR